MLIAGVLTSSAPLTSAGQRDKRDPFSTNLYNISSLLPTNSLEAQRYSPRNTWSYVLKQDNARRKQRLNNNAATDVVKSNFTKLIDEESRERKLPSTTRRSITTESPTSTSTSMSTSVSMSYTTMSDSAKVTTVLNSDHFLLSRRKLSEKSNSNSRRGSRVFKPPEYVNRSRF